MTELRLKQAVQTILNSFLEQRQSSHADIPQDVYRTIRDEADLLLQRECICDVFDSDPFGLVKPDDDDDEETVKDKEKNADMIARVKKLLKVSCTRTATTDGYSIIQAIVQLNNDGNMKTVKDNVRLHFCFLREPQHDHEVNDETNNKLCAKTSEEYETESGRDTATTAAKRKRNRSLDARQTKKLKNDIGSKLVSDCIIEEEENSSNGDTTPDESCNNAFKPKTIITYKVEYSVDCGKLEKLFGVDIYASGQFPSVEEAMPIIDDADNTKDEESLYECKVKMTTGDSEYEEIEMSSNDESEGTTNDDVTDREETTNDDAADRFGVFVDPENVLAFLEHLNLNFNEQSVFHFLLMFPFYEHEWDISGFVLSALFDDDSVDGDDDSSHVSCCDTGCNKCLPDSE